MENASKALLIAGGVLIAMIIASFGVYLYGVYRSHSENVMNRLTENQITEFNAKFTAFEGRELTPNEVVSILNLVRDNNLTKLDNDYQIVIEWGNVSGAGFDFNGAIHQFDDINTLTERMFQDKCIDFIKEYSQISKVKMLSGEEVVGPVYIFTMNVQNYNSNTGLVNSLLIQGKKYKVVT